MAQDTEAAAVQQRQLMETVARANPRKSIAFGPQGKRVDVTPYMNIGIETADGSKFLGAPRDIIRPDRRKPEDWHYGWPKRADARTSMNISAGKYEPVKFEDLDLSLGADVSELKTATGNFVCWEQHILVAIAPDLSKRLYVNPGIQSLVRAVRRPMEVSEELTELFGKEYVPEVTLGDKRDER